MGTRGYIIVRAKDSDKGKSLNFDRRKLDKEIRVLDDSKWRDENQDLAADIFEPTKEIAKPFLAIYSQFDNYPTGTGRALLQHFNDYDKAMNLVAGGTVECVLRDYIKYSLFRRKSLEEFSRPASRPQQFNEPSPCEAYQYLFYGGRWFVRQWATRWYDLEELLVTRGSKADYDLPDMAEYKRLPPYSQREEHNAALRAFDAKWKQMLPTGRNLVHLRKRNTL